MAKVWIRSELTDEALCETVAFVRGIAEREDLPWRVVQEAARIAATLPPLVESEASHG